MGVCLCVSPEVSLFQQKMAQCEHKLMQARKALAARNVADNKPLNVKEREKINEYLDSQDAEYTDFYKNKVINCNCELLI